MFSLVLVVISIALFAAFMAATVNYIPIDTALRMKMREEMKTGLENLHASVSLYFDDNRDINGDVVYPGDAVDLTPYVTPVYGFVPAAVSGLGWTLTSGTIYGQPAAHVCIQPTSGVGSDLQVSALHDLARLLPVGSTFVGDTCWATADLPTGDRLSYWIPLSHIN